MVVVFHTKSIELQDVAGYEDGGGGGFRTTVTHAIARGLIEIYENYT
jgi:hypothetical protein